MTDSTEFLYSINRGLYPKFYTFSALKAS